VAPRSASRRPRQGKFLRGKAFKRHILTSKPTRRKRHARGTEVISPADAGKLRRMLPYD
jgi:large subunit ribosomal protein L35